MSMTSTQSGQSNHEESSVIDPEDCRKMPDVRAGIDALDRHLVILMAKRQAYIEAAGRIKNLRETVRDRARIEDVVSKVLETAQRHGLSADIAEPVWRQLIECSIAHEYKIFDSKEETGPHASP